MAKASIEDAVRIGEAIAVANTFVLPRGASGCDKFCMRLGFNSLNSLLDLEDLQVMDAGTKPKGSQTAGFSLGRILDFFSQAIKKPAITG
jgi:hypothetical protein